MSTGQVQEYWDRGDYLLVNFGQWPLNDAWRAPSNNATHLKEIRFGALIDGLKKDCNQKRPAQQGGASCLM